MPAGQPPPGFAKGDVITAEKLNRLGGEAVREIRVGPGLRITRGPGGLVTIALADDQEARTRPILILDVLSAFTKGACYKAAVWGFLKDDIDVNASGSITEDDVVQAPADADDYVVALNPVDFTGSDSDTATHILTADGNDTLRPKLFAAKYIFTNGDGGGDDGSYRKVYLLLFAVKLKSCGSGSGGGIGGGMM